MTFSLLFLTANILPSQVFASDDFAQLAPRVAPHKKDSEERTNEVKKKTKRKEQTKNAQWKKETKNKKERKLEGSRNVHTSI